MSEVSKVLFGRARADAAEVLEVYGLDVGHFAVGSLLIVVVVLAGHGIFSFQS